MQVKTLIDALHLERCKTVAIIGGGGKSSLMAALGKEYHMRGERTVMTTTTHIFRPEYGAYLGDDPAVFSGLLEQYGLITAGVPIKDGRLGSSPLLSLFPKLADRVIIEADGTKGLPLKVPKQDEPVIPDFADAVVAVAGLSALGRALGDVCHRPELAAREFGIGANETVTPEIMAKILSSEKGQRKGVGKRPYSVLLNQADAVSRVNAMKTAHLLIETGIERVVVTALRVSPDDIAVISR